MVCSICSSLLLDCSLPYLTAVSMMEAYLESFTAARMRELCNDRVNKRAGDLGTQQIRAVRRKDSRCISQQRDGNC